MLLTDLPPASCMPELILFFKLPPTIDPSIGKQIHISKQVQIHIFIQIQILTQMQIPISNEKYKF